MKIFFAVQVTLCISLKSFSLRACAACSALCCAAAPVGGVVRRASIQTGNKALISPEQYLAHQSAVRAAWKYAAAQVIFRARKASGAAAAASPGSGAARWRQRPCQMRRRR